MKVIKILGVSILFVVAISCNNGQAVTKKELKTEVDTVSYALGLNMANQLKINFKDVDGDLFIQGYKNGIDSTNLLLDSSKLTGILNAFFQKKRQEEQKRVQEGVLKRAEEKYGDIKAAGIKFLEENKSKEDVKVTDSGLQYIVMRKGNGKKPTATSKVKVHYKGTFIDGTQFESSYDTKKPVEFRVNGVIKGWTEGLQLMSEGAKYKFFIPQELAYGAFPRKGPIKPFSALVFEIELLKVLP